MTYLIKTLDLSERVLAALCVLAFVAMFCLGIATVVFRFLLESSLAFPDELIRYLFIWLVFLGSAIAFRRNMHAAIGLLVSNLPAGLRRLAMLGSTLVSTGFFAIVLIAGLHYAESASDQISPALEVSMSWVMASVPAGMAILIIYGIELFVRQLQASDAELSADGH